MVWGGVGIEGVKHEVLSPRVHYAPIYLALDFLCARFLVVCPVQCCLPFALLFALALCVCLALPPALEDGRVLRSMVWGGVGIEGVKHEVLSPRVHSAPIHAKCYIACPGFLVCPFLCCLPCAMSFALCFVVFACP